ncbi:ribosome recycling factor [Anaerobacillus isosaccharinicus]|uniref:Ribosome-recycling factor n=1 Tax=Anaerobacillus isosaccharinicus TaxID=1532552 RepID=A0A1S2L925_9BACI|nr:ribosome recycling factor [Anaerobacillus isosaccharinicus]MBA5587303.1 ribosome recycling factor [Anaerobacillus isosaccharinicus]QOY34504.1 ribosome recycling factor [Anaerobacillus isosaccharinicus]
MSKEVIKLAEEKMNKAVDALKRELVTLRAGRANPAILDKIQVEYYGAVTPLNQLASVTVPEARLLVIQPFDKTIINDIDRTIQKSDLGLSPSNDGTVIRIMIPPLTEERRRDLVKLVKKYAEEAKVAIRNIRRDANDDLKKLQKDGEMTEDELRRSTDDVQKLTDKEIVKVDEVALVKEKEIMEV